MTRTRTTRYVTLLSVVLALALTAALAACGSDEPSGGTVPDRTASTPTETPASPARTPTTPGSGDAPTATDEPRPTATRPPLPAIGPTSAKTDREALVALYNATDGENWNEIANWLSDAPLDEWEGVTTNDDGARYTAGPQTQRLERGDAGGLGRPLQPGRVEPQRQRVERGDTGGVGQTLQPGRAGTHQQRVERGRYRRG